MFKKPIYLDHQATTPMDPRVFEVMKPYFLEHFGNSGSTTHEYGDVAAEAVERARLEVAKLINAESSKEIIFTSGATESNNLAIQGVALAMRKANKNHIVTSMIEHKSVLNVVSVLENRGFLVTRIKPEEDGSLKSGNIDKAINERTGLISFMHGNNEIGNINIMKEIGELARRYNVLLHSDAAQTFGKIAVDVDEMNIHLLSISGHKIYGPKGIGALYVRRNSPEVQIEPIVFGGGQEEGIRPGTLAVPLIVGLGEAARIAGDEMKIEVDRIDKLRSRLLSGLQATCPDIVLNGPMKNRLPHCINISFLGVDSDALMNNLRAEIAVSNGSACTSYAPMPSYVLEAIGADKERAHSAIRIGLGRFTTKEEIDRAIECITKTVQNLRCLLASR